jgi:hypothetical protein
LDANSGDTLKKLVGLILATAVALSVGPISSGAVPKPAPAPKVGAVCKPLGKTQVVGTKKYTCVKSGKKIVWGKPVTVSKPKPTPTPTPVAKPTLDNLNANAVYDFSRASVAEAMAQNGTSSLVVNYLVGANVANETIDQVKPDLQKAVNLWGNAFSAADKFTVIWYVQQDLEWAASTYKAESGNPVEWSNINAGCTIAYCGNATATQARNGSFVFEQGMTLDRNGWNRSTAAHEFTHLAQNKLAGQNMYQMPLWLLEGGAQFYGEALGYYPFDSSKSIRAGMHKQFVRDGASFISVNFPFKSLKGILAEGNAANTARLMTLIEFGPGSSSKTGLAYLIGSYATEVLVAVYGHERIIELFKEFQNSTNWESNFQKVYGISTATFYEKLTPYFQKMADELQ